MGKNKIHLVFNEEKRREFLTGFHKRKLQRKKKAKEKLEQDLKEERKRLKAEARECYKKLVKSHTPVPEVENLLADEYEDDDVKVKIVELSTSEIAKQNNWIGSNQLRYQSDEDSKASDDSNCDENKLPGMELKEKRLIKDVKSKLEINRIVKKQATKNMQKSAVFRQKFKIEKQKQKKQARLKKMKFQNKQKKLIFKQK